MRIYFIIFLVSCFTSCGNTSESERLIWSDEFDNTGKPDVAKWNYETGDGCPKLCGWGNNEAQLYSANKANVFIENGLLIINAIKKDNQWTSGKITTQAKAMFTYGRIEFRAKLPKGHGTWPALWMLAESVTTEGWPACGEIDVMEHIGRRPTEVQSALHNTMTFGDNASKASTIVKTFDSEFHVYAANWTKDSIDFYVDNKKFYTYNPIIKDKTTWPYDQPFYIIMNIAMGGNFGGPAIDATLTLVRMEVDYVRVYQ